MITHCLSPIFLYLFFPVDRPGPGLYHDTTQSAGMIRCFEPGDVRNGGDKGEPVTPQFLKHELPGAFIYKSTIKVVIDGTSLPSVAQCVLFL